MSQSRDALIRFMPVSYFWICWNLMPDDVAQLLLGHPDHPAAVANPLAHMHVDGMLHDHCSALLFTLL